MVVHSCDSPRHDSQAVEPVPLERQYQSGQHGKSPGLPQKSMLQVGGGGGVG